MKKIAWILIVLAVLGVLPGCADQPKPSAGPEDQGNGDLSDLSRGIIDERDMAKKTLPPFDEITVVDNDDCAIKMTAVDPYHPWGYALRVSLENKSGGDRFYSFTLSDAKVNGVPLTVDALAGDVHFYEELGRKNSRAESEIILMADHLADKGIRQYEDIERVELTFAVYETLHEANVIYSGTVKVTLQTGL